MAELVRSYTVGPLTSRSPELAKYFGGGGSSMAGVSVNEHNISSVSAVWAAVGLLSDDISSLPLMLYKRLPNGGKDKFETHPLYRLLHDEPNPEMTSMVFRRTMQAHASIWQNAYAEIERDKVGRPIALWPLVPESVRVARDRTRALVYVVSNPDGGEVTVPAADMIHLVGRSHDGTVGSSLVEKAKESIGLALAAEQFGATFFGNGATFGGVISFTGAKPPEMSDDNYRQQLEARHQGVKRAHKLLALYNGATYTETGVEPNSAQFLETRTFQIREVARWFKIPPHKLADLADATFSNVEQMNTEYYTSAIRPWLVLWEQELTRKLVSRLERSQQFIEHSIEGFLRGDTAARSAFYTALFNIGAITINEVRGYENLDPLPGGDQAFVQVNNLMPLDKVNEHAEAQIEAMKAPKSAPAPAAPAQAHEPDPAIEQMSATLAGIESRLVEHVSRAATLEAALAAKDAELKAIRTDADAARQAVTEREQKLAEAEAAHRAAQAETVERTAEQIATLERDWIVERDRLQQARDAAQAEKNDLDVMLGAAEKARAEAQQAADASARDAELLRQRLQAEEDERKAIELEASIARGAVEELRAQVAAHQAQADSLTRAAMEAEAAKALAEARAAERDAAATVAQAEAVAHRATVARRVDGAPTLYRGLYADAMGRMVRREVAKAKAYQATPAKLRTWIHAFYDETELRLFTEALLPSVRLHLAWIGSDADPEAFTRGLVRAHFDESVARLTAVCDAGADGFGDVLQRVLQRWEQDRAEQFANALMAEEIAHDGRAA